MEKQDLMTILIQTGFNIERMFQDKAIKKEAYTVLKYRNDLAIAELKRREAESSHESSGLNKPVVSNNEALASSDGVAVCCDNCYYDKSNHHGFPCSRCSDYDQFKQQTDC